MGSRPTRRPRWAYDAPGGQLVEPPSAYAAAGFYSSERPPAQWANYLFHFTTAWTDYLAGPGWGSWERVSHGGSAPVFTGVTGLAVDPDDIRAGEGRLRYLMVGAETGPAPIVAASRTGREWVERPVPTGCTELLGACYVGDQFLVWGWGADARGRTWITDAHGGASSVLTTNDAAQWTEILPLAENLVHSAAWDGTNGIVLMYGTTRLGVAWSTDGGASWTSSIFTEASSLSTYGAAVVYDPDRARYIIGATGGEIGIFDPTIPAIIDETVLPDAPGSLRPHLHLGDGTCIAWASTEEDGTPLTKSLVWRSDDGGETWAEVELPVLPEIGASITDVTYADGVWLATTTAAPYLWRSDDGGATWERVQLPLGEESSWALHRAVYADGAVTATGLTWTVQTARATGLAPDATRVYSPEPGYLADAGYLRGRRITSTAPTDGQVLVWDAPGGLWVPETPAAAGMSNPMTTLGDSIRGGAAGAPERVGVGTEGQVWTVVGGVPDWAPAPSGGVDTTLQTPSDGGWSQTGTGTMIASAGVVTLTASGSNTVGALHAQEVPSSPHMPAVELRCRVVATSLPSGGVYSLELGLTNAAQTLGYRVRLTHNGSIEDRGSTTGSWGFNGSTIGAGLDWSAGTTWLRIVATPAYIALFYGTGVGAAPPSTWTRNAYVYTGSAAPAWDGELSHLHVQATRASGTGDLVVELHDFGLRCLLGAPT